MANKTKTTRRSLSHSLNDDDASGIHGEYVAIDEETLPVRGSLLIINTPNEAVWQNEHFSVRP